MAVRKRYDITSARSPVRPSDAKAFKIGPETRFPGLTVSEGPIRYAPTEPM